jgi:hypothetical protein
MRVVNGIHRDTTDFRAPTEPSTPSSFTQFNVPMLGIADLTDGRATIEVNHTDLTGGQSELAPITVFSEELCGDASGATHLGARADL